MSIPSEPIGSLPRTSDVLNAMSGGDSTALAKAVDVAVRESVEALEAAGSPVVTDGEQAKASAWTYPLDGADNLTPDGVVIPYADGHQRQLPALAKGPFRYRTHAEQYLRTAQKHAKVPVKQAVAAPSALSLLYPASGIAGYSREQFVADLLDEAEKDIRGCLDAGAHCVQLDFEEARLSSNSTPAAGSWATSSNSTTRSWHASPKPSAPGSASTPAQAATRTPPTASTSTTPSCFRTCSG